MDKMKRLFGDDEIISHSLDFVKKDWKEGFLYLENGEVEKTLVALQMSKHPCKTGLGRKISAT